MKRRPFVSAIFWTNPPQTGNSRIVQSAPLLDRVGHRGITLIHEVGAMMLLLVRALRALGARPVRWQLFVQQMEFIGAGSLFIVLLTGSFTGLVLALQLVDGFSRFQAEGLTGATMSLALCREMGPVLTGLIVTGRVGSSMATELGTMRVTEQIDALKTMAVDPIQYLVSPRILAGLVMVPVLTLFFTMVALIGAEYVTVEIMGVDRGLYKGNIRNILMAKDIYIGLVKSVVFGITITTVACYKGYYAFGGARGVGNATTQSVVHSFIAIFILDYVITAIWL